MLLWMGKIIFVLTLAFWCITESKSVPEDKDALPLEDPNFCQRSCIQEKWRCFSKDDSDTYIEETHRLLMNFASNSRQCDPDVYPDGCEPCVGPVIDPKDSKWCPEGSEGQSFQTSCNCHSFYKCEVQGNDPIPRPCIYKCGMVDSDCDPTDVESNPYGCEYLIFDPVYRKCVPQEQAQLGLCWG